MSTSVGRIFGVRGRRILGRNIRHHRLKAGLSQQQLADLMGTVAPRISDYERGRIGCTVDVIDRIAEVLGISIASLFDEDTPSPPKGERAPRKSEAPRLPRPRAKKRATKR